MKRQQKQKEPKSPLLYFGIAIGCVVIFGIIALGINSYRNSQAQKAKQEEQVRQEKIRKEKARPKFKAYQAQDNSGSDKSEQLTKKQATKRLSADINYGFKLMQQTDALVGTKITQKQLSTAQRKNVAKYFDSLTVFNSFNQATNISTASGQNFYGQNGHNKTYKTSKQGAPYRVTGGSVEYNGSSYNDYIFDVLLQYKAGAYSSKRWLTIYVDKSTGVMTQVKMKGNQNE